jgi:hypothetical protein
MASTVIAILARRQKLVDACVLILRVVGHFLRDSAVLESSVDKKAEIENMRKLLQRTRKNLQQHVRGSWEEVEKIPKIGKQICSKAREICERDAIEE